MPDHSPEGRSVMAHSSCPTEERLTLTVGDSTQRFVPESAYEALLDAYSALRRTVAMSHTHLIFGGDRARDLALTLIERDTGLSLEDARAMQGILMSVADGSLTRESAVGPSA